VRRARTMMETVLEKKEDIERRKKVVLWISRHRPLPAQIDYLRDRIGDFELIQHDKPLSTADDAIKLIKQHNADYVVPVLPLSFIAHLVSEAKKHGFTILRAEMEHIHNCDEQPCPQYNPDTDTVLVSKDYDTGEIFHRHYRFIRFVVLKDIKIITEPF